MVDEVEVERCLLFLLLNIGSLKQERREKEIIFMQKLSLQSIPQTRHNVYWHRRRVRKISSLNAKEFYLFLRRLYLRDDGHHIVIFHYCP